jgi:hypothetical protein
MRLIPNFIGAGEIAALSRFVDRHDFEPGRQGTGYEKLALKYDEWPLARERCLAALGVSYDTAHDCYMLRYQVGASIPAHVDDAPLASEHHRINVCVVEPVGGGVLYVDGSAVPLRAGDAYVFRPDVEGHEVAMVTRGVRLMFTVGILR